MVTANVQYHILQVQYILPEYYLELIKTMESMGADSICIKDMAGVLTPYKAYDLVKRIKEMTDNVPIDLHTHCTGGIADMTIYEGC